MEKISKMCASKLELNYGPYTRSSATAEIARDA